MDGSTRGDAAISVVVPMYNASSMIGRCLSPLVAMMGNKEVDEIIVVDDCSTDGSLAKVAEFEGVRVVRMPSRGGPGAARNEAAKIAAGKYLWFVDSDVVVAQDAARVVRHSLADASSAALIGSYDDRPGADNWLSQYKNLVHHYYHHRAKTDASTFWAGCGVVERELFVRVGGFDAAQYPYPSIEDIELGYRLCEAGARIRTVPTLQGKHLKEWRIVNLLHTEVFRRAIPWSLLMLRRAGLTDDLNVSRAERLRAVAAAITAAILLLSLAGLVPVYVLALCGIAVVVANLDFIRFFMAKRGPWFALKAVGFHQLYYLYSSGAFAYATLVHHLTRLRRSVGGR